MHNAACYCPVAKLAMCSTETQSVFGDIASSRENMVRFIQKLTAFMKEYGFEGVDLDW